METIADKVISKKEKINPCINPGCSHSFSHLYLCVQSFWADIHYRKAQRLSKNISTWKQAASQYERAIFISPENAEYHDEAGQLYSKLAMLHQNEEYFNKAVHHFRKSYQLNPYNAWAHYHLAWVWWNRGMYPEAEKEAEEAIKLDPNNATYHWQLAAVYKRRGKLDKAINEYKEVLRIIPGHSKAREAIRRMEERIQKKK